ncbi:Lrp/AsnC family transcriptional regulator [Ottowia sp.]|uniref:siroheme decarboxylase subunit beta n=1 Tax=Ottowia sp. TaxID=1898956 RepID=UPI003A886D32
MGQALSATETEVIDACRGLLAQGAISRVGGVWAPRVGGAAQLCAMQVPPDRLEQVAAMVSAQPGVNHNYEREHTINLWFVLTGCDAAQVEAATSAIEAQTQLPVLRLRMQRAYRIDLGFDLHQPHSNHHAPQQAAPSVISADMPLAALLESGLPLTPEPFSPWAAALGWPLQRVLDTLERWLAQGTLRRLGLVVRHHEAGFTANAMTVFNAPDDAVDALGERLATQPGVTLCYRRTRAPGWPYNLYCMVHGRHRAETLAALQTAISAAGLARLPHEVLFSQRRFKQQGGRYFAAHAPSSSPVIAPALHVG